MAQVYTKTFATVGPIPTFYGYQTSPGIAFSVAVERFNDEAQSNIYGRHIAAKQQAQGTCTPLRQDTFLTTTSASRTGKSFLVNSGTWIDTWSIPGRDTWAIQQPDNTPGVTFDIIANSADTAIPWCEIVLWRSELPVTNSSIYSPAQTYAYVELASGALPNYRIAMEYESPIRLDITTNGSTWTPAMTAYRGMTLERFLKDNNGQIRIRVEPDYVSGELWVEIGDGEEWLRTVNMGGVTLPANGKIRFSGKNASWGFAYFPLRHAPLTLVKDPQTLTGSTHENAANAYVVTNGLSEQKPNVSYAVQTDGQAFGFTVQASEADDGLGNGSPTAPVMTDATLIVEPVFDFRIPGDFSIPVVTNLRAVETTEVSVFDDNSRCLSTSGHVTINNYNQIYNGAFGNFALDLRAQLWDENSGPIHGSFSRCQGVCGHGEQGIEFLKADATRLITLPFQDKQAMMSVPLGQEVILDGWCLFAAVRWLAMAGNIHPKYLATIPSWGFGPADFSCPYPILGRGTGQNPKYRVTPEFSPLSYIGYLAQDSGVPIGNGISLPFIYGFAANGQFLFQAFDPLQSPPVVLFTGHSNQVNLRQSVFPILNKMRVWNSTAQLRSEVNFQGLNPLSYKLEQAHIENSVGVKKAIGWRHSWLERNARYGGFIEDIAETGAYVSSLPSQYVEFDSIMCPWLYAGQTIAVRDDSIGGFGLYVVTMLSNHWGSDPTGSSGARVCSSTVVARNVTAYPSSHGILF